MKNSTFNEIKSSKIFKPFDLIIYGLVFVLILVFFLAFVVFKNNDSVAGFKVEVDNQTIITFEYQQGIDGFTFFDDYSNLVLIEQNDKIIICKIFTNPEKTDYNVLEIDYENKRVKMQDANCKNKDCTHFSTLQNSGSIICIPHNLVVSPLEKITQKDIVVG